MAVIKPPSIKQLKNEKALTIYAAVLCTLILLAVVSRRLRVFYNKRHFAWPAHKPPKHPDRILVLLLEKLEKRAKWKWIGRPSVGFIVLVTLYLASNVILSFTVFAAYRVNHFASRFGWLGAANMALCVIFGLKNTPLSLLTAVSHTQLNILHRFAGYTTMVLVLLHAILYAVHFGRQGRWETLLEPGNIEGLGAGLAMLVLLMGIFRHRSYEAFYASHFVGFIAAVVLTGLHRPDSAKKLPIVMLFVAGLWLLDRAARAANVTWNLINNKATFHTLPGGGTRILLKKPNVKAALPGSHCFLWIPRIRLFQSHPFTIVNSDSSGIELVMKSRGGFTRAAYDFSIEHSGSTAWVSVDGPYGSLPDLSHYESLVLVAGGSGAAFTFGLVNRALNFTEAIKIQSIHFVWAVKRTEHLTWYSDHLRNLAGLEPCIRVRLYVTGEGADSNTSGHPKPVMPGIVYGRLSVEDAIGEAMRTAGSSQRTLVAACGPRPLMDSVRDSTDAFRACGHRIDVYCEDFGG